MADSVTEFKQAARHVCNTVTNMCLGAIIIMSCMIGFFFTSPNSVRLHVVLNVLGYVLLMPQAILALSDYCSWARFLAPDVRTKVHIVLHILGSILVIAGTAIKITGMRNIGFSNFTSAHGIFGLIAMIMTILNLLIGAINYFNRMDIRAMKMIHSLLGCLTIVAAFIAIIIAFNLSVIVFIIGQGTSIVMIIITAFAMIDIGSCAFLKMIRSSK